VIFGAPAWVFAALVAVVQDDDLGSQPAATPSAADLGAEDVSERAAAAPLVRRVPSIDVHGAAGHLTALQTALLGVWPADQDALDGLLAHPISDAAFNAAPPLRSWSKLAKGWYSLGRGRRDEAKSAIADGFRALSSLPPSERGRVRGGLQLLAVELALPDEASLFSNGACADLGLPSLRKEQARLKTARWAKVKAAFEGARITDRFWHRRLAHRWLGLLGKLIAEGSQAGDLRGVPLPTVFAISTRGDVDPSAELHARWRDSRDSLTRSIEPNTADEALHALLQQGAVGPPSLTIADAVVAPAKGTWRAMLSRGPGSPDRLERFDGTGFVLVRERLSAGTTSVADDPMLWRDVNTGSGDLGRSALMAAAAWAPNNLAKTEVLTTKLSGTPADQTTAARAVAAMLHDPTATAVVEGMPVVDRWLDLLVTRFQALPDSDQATPFADPYGAPAAILDALAALVRADRRLVPRLLRDERLPLAERVWLIADVADGGVQPRLQELAWDRDDKVAALAVWSLYRLVGHKVTGYGFVRIQAPGRVGCVSRTIESLVASSKP
jgi:hypothetical protein